MKRAKKRKAYLLNYVPDFSNLGDLWEEAKKVKPVKVKQEKTKEEKWSEQQSGCRQNDSERKG